MNLAGATWICFFLDPTEVQHMQLVDLSANFEVHPWPNTTEWHASSCCCDGGMLAWERNEENLSLISLNLITILIQSMELSMLVVHVNTAGSHLLSPGPAPGVWHSDRSTKNRRTRTARQWAATLFSLLVGMLEAEMIRSAPSLSRSLATPCRHPPLTSWSEATNGQVTSLVTLVEWLLLEVSVEVICSRRIRWLINFLRATNDSPQTADVRECFPDAAGFSGPASYRRWKREAERLRWQHRLNAEKTLVLTQEQGRQFCFLWQGWPGRVAR